LSFSLRLLNRSTPDDSPLAEEISLVLSIEHAQNAPRYAAPAQMRIPVIVNA